jgi:hypothetical protein
MGGELPGSQWVLSAPATSYLLFSGWPGGNSAVSLCVMELVTRRSWRSEKRGVRRHWTVDSFVPEKRANLWLLPEAEAPKMPPPLPHVDLLMRSKWPNGVSLAQLRRLPNSMAIAAASNRASAAELISRRLAEPGVPRIRVTSLGKNWRESAKERMRVADENPLTLESISNLGSLVLLRSALVKKVAIWAAGHGYDSVVDSSALRLDNRTGERPDDFFTNLKETLEQWHMVAELHQEATEHSGDGGHDHGGGGHHS